MVKKKEAKIVELLQKFGENFENGQSSAVN